MNCREHFSSYSYVRCSLLLTVIFLLALDCKWLGEMLGEAMRPFSNANKKKNIGKQNIDNLLLLSRLETFYSNFDLAARARLTMRICVLFNLQQG